LREGSKKLVHAFERRKLVFVVVGLKSLDAGVEEMVITAVEKTEDLEAYK
jgi:hypothetical protein